MAAQLLEKERNAPALALIAQVFEPSDFSLSCPWLTLAASDQPADPIEIQIRQLCQ